MPPYEEKFTWVKCATFLTYIGLLICIVWFIVYQITDSGCNTIYGVVPPSYLLIIIDLTLFDFLRSSFLLLGITFLKQIFGIKCNICRKDSQDKPESNLIEISEALRISESEAKAELSRYDVKAIFLVFQSIQSYYVLAIICLNFKGADNYFQTYENLCGIVIYSNIFNTAVSLFISFFEDCFESFVEETWEYIQEFPHGTDRDEIFITKFLSLFLSSERWRKQENFTIVSLLKGINRLWSCYGVVGQLIAVFTVLSLVLSVLIPVCPFFTHVIPGILINFKKTLIN